MKNFKQFKSWRSYILLIMILGGFMIIDGCDCKPTITDPTGKLKSRNGDNGVIRDMGTTTKRCNCSDSPLDIDILAGHEVSYLTKDEAGEYTCRHETVQCATSVKNYGKVLSIDDGIATVKSGSHEYETCEEFTLPGTLEEGHFVTFNLNEYLVCIS